MSILKRIIAWMMIFATVFSVLCVPTSAAADPAPADSRGDFYDWVINSGSLDSSRPGGSFGGGRFEGGGGRFSKEQYDEYVDSLPATNINSAGLASFYITGWTYDVTRWDVIVSSLSDYPCVDSYRIDHWCTFVFATSGFFTVPVTGEYEFIFPKAEISREDTVFSKSDRGKTVLVGGAYDSYFLGNCDEGFSKKVVLVAGEQYSIKANLCADAVVDQVAAMVSYRIYRPYITGSRSTFSGTSDTYNINTRPTSITGGNYGIVGDDGTINTVTNNNKIVNETTNNYYNPATGEAKPILDWSYNYENRTYDLTLDTGDKVSVEYGDQNITITENTVVEGDTIVNQYTVYYMIDGSTPACVHDWQAGETTAPTCISPGKTLNTCSKCGASSVDIVPALGHDWKVLRTVPTEYDEDGNQTQAGYTLYECTRCGEQYKDVDSTGPPDNSVNDGGLLEFLNGIIKYLSDNLSGVVELLRRCFSEIPKLFSGFTDFLAAVFPFLPDEIMLLFTFGIAAVVLIGVIKAIRR